MKSNWVYEFLNGYIDANLPLKNKCDTSCIGKSLKYDCPTC